MELAAVRAFLLLAEQSHFGRAAALLHLSQPALTKTIHRLEEEVGGRLFTRGRQGARLTNLGQQFLAGARALVADGDRLLAQARRAARGETGRLRIGFGFHTLELVPRLLVRLRRALPEVEVTLRDMSTREQVEGLGAGRIDLGFVRLPAGDDGLETFPVVEDRLMLVTGPSADLPVRPTLDACRALPFVLISRERSPTMRQHVLGLCAKHGFHPRIVQEVPEVTTALALVRAGLGVSLFSQSFGVTRMAGVRFHSLEDPEAGWSVGAAWRRDDPNPILHRFLAMIRPGAKESKSLPSSN